MLGLINPDGGELMFFREERVQELFRQISDGLGKCTCHGCTVEAKQAINVLEHMFSSVWIN
jgi:hypothetical protein